MKLKFASFLLLTSSLWGASPDKRFDIKDWHCGLDTYHSSLTIDDCFVQDALNVYFDKEAYAQKRGGYTVAFSSSPNSYSGSWSYTDASNNIWFIARSSDVIMATTGIGTSSFNVRIASVSVNDIVNAVNALGNIYFVDQTQGVYYWNGSVTTRVVGSPRGSLIATYRNRVWVSGLAVPNGNYLYGSKYLDGTTWTTGSLATDAVVLQVGLQDNFDNITALQTNFNDAMYIFKNYSTRALAGTDQTDFQIRDINAEVGCIDQRSIQPIFGGLVFASPRGIEFFDGFTATRISDPIKDLVDPITLNSSFAQYSWIEQTAADWNAGTFSPETSYLTTSRYSPNLTTSFTESSDDSTFASGTFTSTVESAGSVLLAVSNIDVSNNSFETGDKTSWGGGYGAVTTQGGLSPLRTGPACTLTPQNASYFLSYNFTGSPVPVIKVAVKECSDNAELTSISFNQAANSCTHTLRTIPMSSLGRKCVYLDVLDSANSATIATSNSFFASGTDITFYSSSDNDTPSPGITHWLALDNFKNGESSILTGSYRSRTYDTQIINHRPVVYFAADWTTSNITNGNPNFSFTPTIQFQTSADGTSWSNVGTSTGTNYVANRYLRYLSTFTPTAFSTNADAALLSVTFTWAPSSAVYQSPCHGVGNTNSFANLAITQDVTGGGSIAYAVCSSSMASCSPKTCGSTLANSPIAIATNTYVQLIATYTLTASTQTPRLQFASIQWYAGTRKPPMASAVYDNRYWLSVTTNTADTTNDATLVLSKGPVWTLFDIKAGSFLLWKNGLYHCDANETGRCYQNEQGLSDAGSAINSYVVTKDYALDGIISDKVFKNIYLLADNMGAYSIYTNYFVDRSTTSFSLATVLQNETPGTLITKLNFPIDSTHQDFGRTISFKFQQNDADAPFKIYGGVLTYRVRPPI